MQYSQEVENMCPVAKGAYHGPAPIPEEGKWVQAKEISDISGLTHGVGWCAPQQGACKLTLNVKDGIIEEALVETIGCSGMTHSAAMAGEILPGKTILEALNTDLVCDAINVAMRELFLQIVYGRSQTAFSEGGLPVGASLDDLGKGLRSQVGTMFGTKAKGARYLELAQGYVTRMALNDKNEIIAFEFLNLGKFTDAVKAGKTPEEAIAGAMGHYGQWENAAKYIDPRTDEETHSVASVFPVHEGNGREITMTVTFEGYERRADKINKCLADNGIASLEEALQICTDKGFNPREIVNNTQSIAFQNAEWAYTLGCALAVKRNLLCVYQIHGQ